MLSVCLIVRDEAPVLRRCLLSILPVADEIIVVDTGSADNTREIAREFGARVFDFVWCDDFAKARNFSIAQARYPWIMWQDADDELPAESAYEINDLKRLPADFAVKFLLRNSYTAANCPTERSDIWQTRMFPNHIGIKFENQCLGRLHENVDGALKGRGLPEKRIISGIIHHGYESAEKVEEKLMRNIRLCMLGIGFTDEAGWWSMQIGEYRCVYAPNSLIVWKFVKPVAAVEPFKPEEVDSMTEGDRRERLMILSANVVKQIEDGTIDRASLVFQNQRDAALLKQIDDITKSNADSIERIMAGLREAEAVAA